MNDRERNLVADVRQAFAGTEYPGNDKILYDNNCRHSECIKAYNAFSDTSWDGLDNETVRSLYDIFPFITDAAFRYFLPRFLILCLEDIDEADTITSSVITWLTPPSERNNIDFPIEDYISDDEWQNQYFDSFTHRQRHCIAGFLMLIRDQYLDPNADQALKTAWGRVVY